MLRKNDPVLHHVDISFWEYAEKMDDGSMGCKFCGHPFAKGTSITRIKSHLAGVKGRGVRICGKVPQDVQDAALAASDGPPEKKLKTGAGSSNNEVTNVISASAQQQNNEMMMTHQREDLSLDEDCLASITAEDMELLVIGSFNERPSFNQADEPRGDPSQPTNDQLCSPSVNNDVIVNDAQNVVGVRTEPVVQVLEQSNAELDNLFVDAGSTQVGFQGMEQGGEEGRVCSHLGMENTGEGSGQHVNRIVPPTIDENYNRREATERSVHHGVGASSFVVYGDHNAISTSQQEQNNEVDNFNHMYPKSWKEIVQFLEDDIDNGTGGVAQPGAGASSSGGLTGSTNEIKRDALPTRKLVGQAFEHNKKFIRSLLMDDKVSSIGIHGMGGVGKTALVTHLYNQLIETPKIHVYRITASQDTSIYKLQTRLARSIKLDLSNEDDELDRAVTLKKELMKKKPKCVLILDDLWKAFDLKMLGIPDQDEGCKLILTTRSKKICQQMKTQHTIKVWPIREEEAWTLFIERLGRDIELSPEVKQIAGDVVRECAGLPLGIITMAGCMRGVYDPHEWRNTLKKLKGSKSRDMEDEVFRLLRFSYDRLDNDSALQQCLLYCALFPEDHCIEREELIGYLIDEGIIEEKGSRQAGFDEGHTMLNKLEDVSLLERGVTYQMRGGVKMHDLIRDMAIQILQKNSQTMVKAGAQLRELPDEKEWTENFTRVSLMHNKITEIPSIHSPRCPSLSTLLLCRNPLVNIADSFFERLHGLKVLDLSYTEIIKLPDSVSRLVSLTALVLKKCKKLRHVPSLEKLTALKKLDLTRTALEKMPQGMECLRNLEYLAMNRCGESEFPSGLLLKLSHLQVLVIEEKSIDDLYALTTIKGKEVGCLKKLESLKCQFEGHSGFVEYLKSRDETQSLSTYRIWVGHPTRLRFFEVRTSKTIALINLSGEDLSGEDFQAMFPKDIQQLIIGKCHDATSLCDVFSLINYATELEDIDIRHCDSMESLVSSSNICSALSLNGTFSCLKMLRCDKCGSMKRLFPLVLLQNLVNLEMISVRYCQNMEEIIGEEWVAGEESSSNTEFKLSKLRELQLDCLPALKRISSAKVICDSLQKVDVERCKSMEILFPSSWSLVSLEKIRVSCCEKMEEIIGGARSDGEGVMGEESSSSTEIKLSKLRKLQLDCLPELKRISSAKVICDSLQEVHVMYCHSMEILFPSSWSLVNLESLQVEYCEKMEEIIGGARSDEEGVMGEVSISSTEIKLSKLRKLHLDCLPELKRISSAKVICDSLEEVDVERCNSMEILFPSSWSLVSLEKIRVSSCDKMEEIIGGARWDEEGVMGEESSSSTEIKLSKLTLLDLKSLPELKRISSAKVICDSLQRVDVEYCDNMEILFPSSWSLLNLEWLYVQYCEKMEEIIGGTNEIILPKLRELDLKSLSELKRISSAKVICDSLQEVCVSRCNSMEILFPSSWSLVNLEWLEVEDCEKMEEIKGGTNEIILPKITHARFYKLPKMKSICSAKLIFNNLTYDFGEWASQEESDYYTPRMF